MLRPLPRLDQERLVHDAPLQTAEVALVRPPARQLDLHLAELLHPLHVRERQGDTEGHGRRHRILADIGDRGRQHRGKDRLRGDLVPA